MWSDQNGSSVNTSFPLVFYAIVFLFASSRTEALQLGRRIAYLVEAAVPKHPLARLTRQKHNKCLPFLMLFRRRSFSNYDFSMLCCALLLLMHALLVLFLEKEQLKGRHLSKKKHSQREDSICA